MFSGKFPRNQNFWSRRNYIWCLWLKIKSCKTLLTCCFVLTPGKLKVLSFQNYCRRGHKRVIRTVSMSMKKFVFFRLKYEAKIQLEAGVLPPRLLKNLAFQPVLSKIQEFSLVLAIRIQQSHWLRSYDNSLRMKDSCVIRSWHGNRLARQHQAIIETREVLDYQT